jgi:hypothetical protein
MHTLQGVLFEDHNNDGIQDEGEPGIAGATLYLRSQERRSLTQEWTTQTNQQGVYTFANIPPGSYQLGFQLPSAYGDPVIYWNDIALDGSQAEVIYSIPAVANGFSIYLPMLQR